jgi:hypothetical protein
LLAYKWLREDGRSAISGFHWPLPRRGRPGAWVDVEGDLVLCRNGLHACRVRELAHWLGPELWGVELGGRVVDIDGILVSSRARLVQAVPAWAAGARTEFAWACTTRAQESVREGQYAGELEDLIGFARIGDATAAGYVAALLKGKAAAGGLSSAVNFDRGFLEERALQAQWLAARLGLVDDAEGPGWTG